jgi:hypothetical protein
MLLCACLVVSAGCENAAEKCAKARDAAAAAWTSYVQAIEQGIKAAREAHAQAQHALTGAIEQRLTPGAQKVADGRYPRSSEAWLRAYRTAYEDACAKDSECNRRRQQSSDAKIAVEDLADRLPHAQAALAAARSDAEQARQAAKAVVGHPEFAQYQQAQTLSIAAYKACQAVVAPPAAP